MTGGFSEADREWARLNLEAIEHARNNDWGLYTNTRLDMADHLKREGSPRLELEMLLYVLYLDANGADNRGGCHPDLLSEFPPFDPNMAVIPPAIVARATAIFSQLGLGDDDARAMFIEVAAKRRNKLMPIAPEAAWENIGLL